MAGSRRTAQRTRAASARAQAAACPPSPVNERRPEERAALLSRALPYRRRARPPRGQAPRWDRQPRAASRPRTAESSPPSAGCGCRGCRAGWSPSDPSPRLRRKAWRPGPAPPGRPRGSPGRRSPQGAAGAWRAVTGSGSTRCQPPLPTATGQPHPTEAQRGPYDQGRGGAGSRLPQWHPSSCGAGLSSESRAALAPPVSPEEQRWGRGGRGAAWRRRGCGRRGSSGAVRSACYGFCLRAFLPSFLPESRGAWSWETWHRSAGWRPRGNVTGAYKCLKAVKWMVLVALKQCPVTERGTLWTNWNIGSSIWAGGKPFLRGWQSSGTGCLERQWSLLV